MSHPPPPGTNLPARPPASNSRPGFRSSFNQPGQPAAPPSYTNANSARASVPSYPAAPAASAAATHYGSSYQAYPSRPPATGVSHSAAAYSFPQQHQQHGAHQQPQSYAPHAYSQPQSYQAQPYQAQSYQAAPRIQNPFPTPSANTSASAGIGPSVNANVGASASGTDYDPDMAAQIAQWQSAYAPQIDKDGKPLPAAEYAKAEGIDAAAQQPDKSKTVVREGGGKKWTDDTLLEWDPSHLRLFVGNLAGETTDESLLKAFSRWKSVQKARVIRDKRTTKSKGYGFVSFSDADDFFQAAKEMHGKYIQSHPVVVKKANTEIKATNVKNKAHGGKKNYQNNKNNRNNNNNSSNAGGYEPQLGPKPGAGIAKPGQKTKNGLRLLG
ncbi:uncharacterized protein TrAtP1_003899 [Trichoderma atroviride]|nr:hypothetical protein TrAtP1_003899 [Trichoderma atroviride]